MHDVKIRTKQRRKKWKNRMFLVRAIERIWKKTTATWVRLFFNQRQLLLWETCYFPYTTIHRILLAYNERLFASHRSLPRFFIRYVFLTPVVLCCCCFFFHLLIQQSAVCLFYCEHSSISLCAHTRMLFIEPMECYSNGNTLPFNCTK